MDHGSPNDFLRRMFAGEFDGRLHEVLSELTTEQLQAIVKLSDRSERRFGPGVLKIDRAAGGVMALTRCAQAVEAEVR